MAVPDLYEASLINPRRRAPRDEMEERAEFLIDYAERHGPVTVRQLYYQAEMRHVPGIDKTDSSYDKIQRQVLALRRAKRLRYGDIADSTRWMRKPRTFNSVEAALQDTARYYRKSLWRDAEVYLEIWLEKDALAGVVYPVTELYDVPLMVARGFSSETFCFEAIDARVGDPRPYHVYYLGDFDRAGRDAAATLKEKLQRFAAAKGVQVGFGDLAIDADDIVSFDGAGQEVTIDLTGVGEVRLPTRAPKRKTSADKNWPHDFACELDAIEPDDLRAAVQSIIEYYLPPTQLEILRTAEESERALIGRLVGMITDEAAG
jgi:hypothetical protein